MLSSTIYTIMSAVNVKMFSWTFIVIFVVLKSVARAGTYGTDVQVKVEHDGTMLAAIATIDISTEDEATFLCTGDYPTEWAADLLYLGADGNMFSSPFDAWTVRNESQHGSTSYEAHVVIRFNRRLRFEETLVCRAVGDHTNQVRVHIQTNWVLVQITQERNNATLSAPGGPDEDAEESCKFFVEVVETPTLYYWRCESVGVGSGLPIIQFKACRTSQLCALSHQPVRILPKCVSVRKETTPGGVYNGSMWMPLNPKNHQAGVAWCHELSVLLKGSGATLEYFLMPPKGPGSLESLREISVRELLWVDPVPDNGNCCYTPDTLETMIHVARYGLSYFPTIDISRNGVYIQNGQRLQQGEGWLSPFLGWFLYQNLSLHFGMYGPGLYEIRVTAPVWNTTEHVNHTTQISVRDPVLPFFKQVVENVTYRNGDAIQWLPCDAEGDPVPEVRWEHPTVPGIRQEGRSLTLTRIQTEVHDKMVLRCFANNTYGVGATKTFNLHVEPEDSSQSVTMGTVIVVATGSLGFLIIGGAIIYLYRKFVRFGQSIRADAALSGVEIKEFHEGTESDLQQQINTSDLPIPPNSLPYNSAFELDEENLIVDFNTELGSGNFGVVYKGQVLRDNGVGGLTSVAVAVKTVRPNVPIEYFKALMSELKILAFIGSHENIANLVGAFTGNLVNRELYVGIELCMTSLLLHLRGNSTASAGASPPIATVDLIRWAAETASGMEFLELKRIVHSDLAARNVLLSFDFHAKISDFGLARQLVNYEYTKQSKEALPWKWMAIESLAHMHFSTASDMWAFGILCWEVFSLGAVPYPCTGWSPGFLQQLIDGTRLSKPTYASDTIFEKMLECWRLEKEDRPKFGALKQFFSGQLVDHLMKQCENSDYISAP